MLIPEHKRRLGTAAIFALPIILVKGAALFMSGPAPSVAVAALKSATPAAMTPVAQQTQAISPEINTAAQYTAALRTEPFPPSPLYVQEQLTVRAVAPKPSEQPQLKLQVLLVSHNDSLAVIDGQTVHTGDRLTNGWIVRFIDPANHSVVVEEPLSGQQQILSVQH